MQAYHRTFIVGDVHGCFDELMNLLKLADYDPAIHRLILLGDLINKGPHSLRVLSWLHEAQSHSPQPVDVVMGNHELKFIKAIENSSDLPPILEDLKQEMGESVSHWFQWIKSWPAYIEEPDFLAVHGGLVPNEPPQKSRLENLVNIRYWDNKSCCITKNSSYPPWHDLYKDSKLVVYAHWAQQGLKIKINSIGLDTGCVYGRKLTGVWLPERKIVQTPALAVYNKV